jgi:hypothetical protein
MGLPVARQNGQTITGRMYAEIIVDNPTRSQPFYWGNSDVYPSVSLDHTQATLTMRPSRAEPAVQVPHDRWAFGRWEQEHPGPRRTASVSGRGVSARLDLRTAVYRPRSASDRTGLRCGPRRRIVLPLRQPGFRRPGQPVGWRDPTCLCLRDLAVGPLHPPLHLRRLQRRPAGPSGL